jgi:site-specific recombinase XerD
MTFSRAIDAYITDQRTAGRINSPTTERAYRDVLLLHAQDLHDQPPETASRDDVKRTLARWANPNTQRTRRAVLVSFYDWTMEEGIRPDNPARQTRRPKKRPTTVYRLTLQEAQAMLDACRTTRERRAIYLGMCAGLRNAELRGLQGRHLRRDGYLWVSADIAKGGRERWVPIIGDLLDVVAEIKQNVGPDEYVLPAQRWRNPPTNTLAGDLTKRPCSSQALRTLVMTVAKRAGIQAHIHPHLLRHAFGDHVARHGGIRIAQRLLGHATVSTTETYVGDATLDELSRAVAAFSFQSASTPAAEPESVVETPAQSPSPDSPLKATTGIEPVTPSGRPRARLASNIEALFAPLAGSVALYAEAFTR